mmetsp:Transcript_4780/g.8064  ORF Transcript_4780/g.8064 Transcript_4780/m.8064 type:complete len:202 (-) Transcript_4780:310-915(-)
MTLFGHFVGVVRDPPVDVSNNNRRYVRVSALVRSAFFGDNFVEPHHGEDFPFGEFPGHAACGLAPIIHVTVDVLEGIDGLADGARSVVIDMWCCSGVLGVAGIVRSAQGAASGRMRIKVVVRFLQSLQNKLLQLYIVGKSCFFCAHDLVRMRRHELVLLREPQLCRGGGKEYAFLVDDVVGVLFEAQQRATVMHAAGVPKD